MPVRLRVLPWAAIGISKLIVSCMTTPLCNPLVWKQCALVGTIRVLAVNLATAVISSLAFITA